MQTTNSRIKAAVVREEGHPVGQPVPCYIRCLCGAKPSTDGTQDVRCSCGRLYTATGWLLWESPR